MSNYDYLMKLIMIGNTGVGKSSLLFQLIESKIRTNIEPTIGIEFGTKILEVQGKVVRLQIWDSAGQENYRSITRAYYRSSICAILVYDVTNRKSFDDIKEWLIDTNSFGSESMYLVLIGNKCELEDARVVSTQDGSKFARDHGMLFFEVSALKGTNVLKSFNVIVEKILDDIHKGVIDPNNESHGIKTGMNAFPNNTLASMNITKSQQSSSCCLKN